MLLATGNAIRCSGGTRALYSQIPGPYSILEVCSNVTLPVPIDKLVPSLDEYMKMHLPFLYAAAWMLFLFSCSPSFLQRCLETEDHYHYDDLTLTFLPSRHFVCLFLEYFLCHWRLLCPPRQTETYLHVSQSQRGPSQQQWYCSPIPCWYTPCRMKLLQRVSLQWVARSCSGGCAACRSLHSPSIAGYDQRDTGLIHWKQCHGIQCQHLHQSTLDDESSLVNNLNDLSLGSSLMWTPYFQSIVTGDVADHHLLPATSPLPHYLSTSE